MLPQMKISLQQYIFLGGLFTYGRESITLRYTEGCSVPAGHDYWHQIKMTLHFLPLLKINVLICRMLPSCTGGVICSQILHSSILYSVLFIWPLTQLWAELSCQLWCHFLSQVLSAFVTIWMRGALTSSIFIYILTLFAFRLWSIVRMTFHWTDKKTNDWWTFTLYRKKENLCS